MGNKTVKPTGKPRVKPTGKPRVTGAPAKPKSAEVLADEARREAEIERKKIEAEQKRIAEEKRIAEKKKQEQAAKRKNLDAMIGGISDGEGKATGGEGDDNKPGDKGKITGDPNASGYYGTGGGGGTSYCRT